MNSQIKISITIPILNEQDSIKNLLESLINQTYKADEIIFSDGGSIDNTIKIIKDYQKKYNFIKLISRKGICRGAGRNSAINYAKNNLIALCDAGAYPNTNWLENFLVKYDDSTQDQIIYGSIKPIFTNIFSRNIANIIIGKNHTDGTISPSVASMLITKKKWKSVGCFPESSDGKYIVEDLKFIKSLNSTNYIKIDQKDAIVNWYLPNNLKKIYYRFTEYSRGTFSTEFAKNWHRGFFRNIIILLIIILTSIKYNILFLFLLMPIILLRSYFYLVSMPTYFHKKKLLFYDTIFTSFILIVIDLATLKGIFKYIRYDLFQKKKN